MCRYTYVGLHIEFLHVTVTCHPDGRQLRPKEAGEGTNIKLTRPLGRSARMGGIVLR